MAPKRAKRVVKTTKVVEQTVEVAMIGSQDDPTQVQPNLLQEVEKQRQEQSSITTKTVPIEDLEAHEQAQDTETQEPEQPPEEPNFEKIPTPPREEVAQAQVPQSPEVDQPPEEPNLDKIPTPAREEAAQGKPRKREAQKRGRRKMKEGGEGYKRYVHRVLKQVHPGMGISRKAMTVIDNLMSDMFERVANEASRLSDYGKKQTLTSRELQAAVKLVLPGELGKHAIAEGAKAVSNYMAYDNYHKK